ncbi:ABC transporter permease [Glaciihabitans arcticus]|uniref:ABC transporter permease n=1 Tax=Glaciihabitans arcticus TaxID=2668039 RepID=A0A4Q9GVR9_9MICO|nr:ABC transporter permease [Glaciihabitans arcticus]TBN57287.1 ABC transporter permease [Glaciihabitans arcticus]
MVAHVLRLKLTLLGNSFRRSPWQIAGLVLGIFYGLSTAIFVIAGLVALRFFDVEIARNAAVVLGAAVTIVFTVLPLTLGIDDTLDPRKFGLFGIRTTRLSFVLAVGALVSVPAVVVTAIALGQLVTWSRDGLAEFLAILGMVLIIVTCILSARISTSLAAFLLATRRARDISAIFAIIALIVLSPIVVALARVDWQNRGLEVLGDIADVVGWTPLAAAWAAPADAAVGDPGAAFAKLAIAIAWVLVLVVIWRLLVGLMLVTPERQPHARTYVGLGWFDWFARTPTGAIAARSITYWFRDARYGTSLAIIPLIPVFMVVALAVAGIDLHVLALLPLPVMCLFLSWSIHNDVAFDNTAIWLHMSTSTLGRADRWGRLIPVLVVGLPLIAIGSVVSISLNGDWSLLPSLVGVSVSVLLCGLGLSSIMSARFPYAAVRPGDSPFSQPQGGASSAGSIQALSLLAIIALSAPALTAAVLGFFYGSGWHYLALGIGVGMGLLVLVGGATIGARLYDRRTSELLVSATRN